MIVIVEGVDGSGKSTLCSKLVDLGCIKVRKEKSEKNYTFEEFNELINSPITFVMDRALLTPWAYRLLDGHKLQSDDYTFKQIIELLSKCKIVYCNTQDSYRYSMERGEENITSFAKHSILKMIYNFIMGTIILYNLSTIFYYNFEKNTVDDVIKFIKEV